MDGVQLRTSVPECPDVPTVVLLFVGFKRTVNV